MEQSFRCDSIQLLDLFVIIGYLLGIVLIGLLSVRQKNRTNEGYFLAGKSLPWAVIGASLFASNISTVHLVGLAEYGFTNGIV